VLTRDLGWLHQTTLHESIILVSNKLSGPYWTKVQYAEFILAIDLFSDAKPSRSWLRVTTRRRVQWRAMQSGDWFIARRYKALIGPRSNITNFVLAIDVLDTSVEELNN